LHLTFKNLTFATNRSKLAPYLKHCDMKKKLPLTGITVNSFVTHLEKAEPGTLRGGMKDPSLKQCTDMTCGIVRCTYTADVLCLLSQDC
jgi:hypothetical protein